MTFPLLYKAEAIVLARKNIGEGDRVITLFTKEYGKLRVVAKGLRRITSRRAAHLEVFNHVRLMLHSGKTLDSISEAQSVETFTHLRRDLRRVSVGYYFCDLTARLLAERQEHRDVFHLLLDYLRKLNTGKESFGTVSEDFSRELLYCLGFLARGNAVPRDIVGFVEQIIEKRLSSVRFLTKLR